MCLVLSLGVTWTDKWVAWWCAIVSHVKADQTYSGEKKCGVDIIWNWEGNNKNCKEQLLCNQEEPRLLNKYEADSNSTRIARSII